MNPTSLIRPELLSLSPEHLRVLVPYFFVFIGCFVSVLLCVLKGARWTVLFTSLLSAVLVVASSIFLFQSETVVLFNGMMISDSYANFFNIIFMASAAFTILGSFRYLEREKVQHPEYYLLILFAAMAMMLMVSALDLIVVFISLEMMSLAVYVLVGFRRADRKSNEASMKYFILGSAASAIFLYGVALLYGATLTTNIRGIFSFIQSHPEGMTTLFTLGFWLVLLGFLFKIAAVPFHMWMPDVYEGAPTPITGFMTTGLKAAAFGVFVRVFISLGYGKGLSLVIQNHVHDILWVSAALTMALGNFVALMQTNLKRMLAYSSIAHTGYLLVGIISGAGSEQGYSPVILYLVAYSVMNIGAFTVLTMVSQKQDSGLNLHDISGLSNKHPWLAFSLALFMFSMAGIPPTVGFAAKYFLFYSAIQSHEIILVIISVLCSAVSVYYYLRVLVYMYMREGSEGDLTSQSSLGHICGPAFVVAFMVFVTVQVGVLPSWALMIAKKAVSSL